MSPDVDLSVRQFVEAWRRICAAAPGHAMHSEDGAKYVFSGLPIAFFNVVVPTRQGLDAGALRTSARKAIEWAAGRGVAWFYVVTHELLAPGAGAGAVLGECGLAPVLPLTGMKAGRVAAVARAPGGLQLARAGDDALPASMVTINSAAYGMSLADGMEAVGSAKFWKDHYGVVGLTGGEAVSCAAVMMIEGCRYVAFVATHPAHQRRGYAEAAMRRALELAAREHGETTTVLHATEAGRPVYERMGYETVTSHTMYMEKRFLEGH